MRHIPIFVEGRDEPVLARVVEEDNENRKHPERSAAKKLAAKKSMEDRSSHLNSKTPIPMPFYSSSPPQSGPDTIKSSTAIPLPYPQDLRPQTPVEPAAAAPAANHIPIPLPYVQAEECQSPAPDRVDGTSKKNDLERIDNIQREAEALLPRVQAFHGQRNDREFLYLDEMLTRILLKLDDVEGRDDVRQARRQAIASIQRCINLLESRVATAATAAAAQHPQQEDVIESPEEVDIPLTGCSVSQCENDDSQDAAGAASSSEDNTTVE